jgi:hypothetical protein
LGNAETAGTALQRAVALAKALQSPTLIYPMAYELGYWHERTGQEREARTLYRKAHATIEQMATAVEDAAPRAAFLQSVLVQTIHECIARLGA